MAVDTLTKFNQPIPQPPVQAPVNRFDHDLPDDEFLTGRQVKQILQQVAGQVPSDPVARQLAAQSLYAGVQQARAAEFKRWGQEIQMEISRLPVEHWTLDSLNTLVNIVKSRHIDELAAEQAQRLVNESHPTIRSGTGGSGSGPQTPEMSLEADGIPPQWKAQAQKLGVTEREIEEFCQMTGQTKQQYYAELVKYGKGGVIRG